MTHHNPPCRDRRSYSTRKYAQTVADKQATTSVLDCPECCCYHVTEVPAPKRVRRQRTRGWRMPAGAIYVGRGSKWGNPWTEKDGRFMAGSEWRAVVIDCFKVMLNERGLPGNTYPSDDEIRAELAGRDLACWCPLDAACHADQLLAIAAGSAS